MFKYRRKIHPSFFAVSADTMAAAIRKKKLFLLLSTLYQQRLQRAPGTRMYCALFNKDLEKSSRIAGKIVTAGSEVWIQHWECVTDSETASACLQAVTLFAPTFCPSCSSLKSKAMLF